MLTLIVILGVIGGGWFLANVGAKGTVSLRTVAIAMLVLAVCVIVAWPVIAPYATGLMQVGQHLQPR